MKWLLLLGCFCYGTAYSASDLTKTHLYRAGECYAETGYFEKWEKPAAVKILEVGVYKYHYSLVNFKEGRSFSASEYFRVIEAIYSTKVVCPK